MLTSVVRRSILGAVLAGLLLLPVVSATPPDSETCETLLVAEHCEGTRSDDSASCTNPAANVTVCSTTQRDEEYQSVEALGVGAEWAEVNRTEHTTFEASDGCAHQEGQATLVGQGHAVRTTSPVGGVWVETQSYEIDLQENDSSSCPGTEGTATEEETHVGHSVGMGSDVGPQPLEVSLRAERSEAYLQEDPSDGRPAQRNVTGAMVGVSANGIDLVAVVGIWHHDEGADCERYSVVIFSPLPSQGVDSGCLPILP